MQVRWTLAKCRSSRSSHWSLRLCIVNYLQKCEAGDRHPACWKAPPVRANLPYVSNAGDKLSHSQLWRSP
eukprot:1137909-Heterocapsa_arctica.AAC.1